MRILVSSLFRLYPRGIMGWSRGRKCFPSDWWPLETSLFRLHQIAFSEAENKLRMPFEALKHRFSTSSKSYFGIVHTSKISRVPCETLKHRFFDLTQVAFWVVKRPKMSSKDMRPHWHIAFLTSPTLHFELVKRNKMSLKYLATTWNISFSTSQ